MNTDILVNTEKVGSKSERLIKTILMTLAISITVTSCISPSYVRNGNQKEYFVKENKNQLYDKSISENISNDLENSNTDKTINPKLDFAKDLKSIQDNNDQEGEVDSQLEIPAFTKAEADEISKLTQELLANNPNTSNQSENLKQASAVTGLPTLQNQIDAINETYLEFSDKIDNVKQDVVKLSSRIDNAEEDIADLKTKVSNLIEDSKKKKITADKTNRKQEAKPDKELKGYKLLSDEELESKNNSTKEKSSNVASSFNEDMETEIVDTEDKKASNDPADLAKLKNSMAYKVAMNSISKKNYKQSTIQLNRLRNDYSSKESLAEIDYWLGESAYGQKQYQKALTKFESSSKVQNSERADDASAMIAECMIKLGRIKEAKQEYKDFITDFPESTLIPRARKMLQQL